MAVADIPNSENGNEAEAEAEVFPQCVVLSCRLVRSDSNSSSEDLCSAWVEHLLAEILVEVEED